MWLVARRDPRRQAFTEEAFGVGEVAHRGGFIAGGAGRLPLLLVDDAQILRGGGESRRVVAVAGDLPAAAIPRTGLDQPPLIVLDRAQ